MRPESMQCCAKPTCSAVQSVKLMQVIAGQVGALRSTFKLRNASFQAGDISQKALDLGAEHVDAFVQGRVGLKHILCKAAQRDMQKVLTHRVCGAVGHGYRMCCMRCVAECCLKNYK